MDGYLFETYGKEFEFVKIQNPSHVWTLVESDNKLYVCSGFHHVNRLGYFVTQLPWEEDTTTGAL
jgi:hypothetical protein